MKKSVYSLVLQDDVVEAVDQMAYSRGMNRSGLVNQILAEYASLVTPEKRAGEIFDQVCLMLTPQSHFKILGRPSQKALNISSTLRYKYNPTLRYSVELHRGEDRTAGQLKVSVRSQNAALVQHIEAFFHLWNALEQKYLPVMGKSRPAASIQNGRYIRSLYLPADAGSLGADEIAQILSTYIQMFDQVLKTYLQYSENSVSAASECEKQYLHFLRRGGQIL